MRHLIGEYVTRKGNHYSMGKLVGIDNSQGYNLFKISDFYGITTARDFPSSNEPIRKSSKREIEASKSRAERDKALAKQTVSEAFKSSISDQPVQAEVKPYEIIDTPLNIVNDNQKKIEVDEVEEWTWDTVEDAVKANQSQEIAILLQDGLKAMRKLRIANNRIISLVEEINTLKATIANSEANVF